MQEIIGEKTEEGWCHAMLKLARFSNEYAISCLNTAKGSRG